MWLLIWFVFMEDQGVRYHHLDTFRAETLCTVNLKKARVMVNDKSETIECVFVDIKQ